VKAVPLASPAWASVVRRVPDTVGKEADRVFSLQHHSPAKPGLRAGGSAWPAGAPPLRPALACCVRLSLRTARGSGFSRDEEGRGVACLLAFTRNGQWRRRWTRAWGVLAHLAPCGPGSLSSITPKGPGLFSRHSSWPITAGIAKKPEPPKPSIWNVYKIASKVVWLGAVEASDNVPANRLMRR
jgi:hypothetical protein